MKTVEERLEVIEANTGLIALTLRDICQALGVHDRIRASMATLDELNGGAHDTEPAPAPSEAP